MIMHDSRLSGLGLSPGQECSLVLGQNVLLSAPLSTQVYIMGICELHATEGGRGKGGYLDRLSSHQGGVGDRNAPAAVVGPLHYKTYDKN